MKGRLRLVALVAVVAALAVAVTTAIAGGGKEIREHLTGYQEDPLVAVDPRQGDVQRLDRQVRAEDLLPALL